MCANLSGSKFCQSYFPSLSIKLCCQIYLDIIDLTFEPHWFIFELILECFLTPLPLSLSQPDKDQARAGLLTNQEDTIQGPAASIRAPKMYIWENTVYGPKYCRWDLLFYNIKKLSIPGFPFFTKVLKWAKKTVWSSKSAKKKTKHNVTFWTSHIRTNIQDLKKMPFVRTLG